MAWLKDKGLGCLAAVLLSLSMVAGLMPAPDAFGADAGSGSAGGSPAATPATPSQSAQQPYIADVSIWSHESGATVGVASSPSSAIAARISAKGGTLWFDNVAWWNDGTSVANQSYVSWSVSDPSIATISPGGILTAVGDGIVAVTATATANTQGGAPLACTIYIEVTGQTDARYVSGIRIAGPDGEALSGSYVLEQDLSTATAQFYALVDVVDPATGATQRTRRKTAPSPRKPAISPTSHGMRATPSPPSIRPRACSVRRATASRRFTAPALRAMAAPR